MGEENIQDISLEQFRNKGILRKLLATNVVENELIELLTDAHSVEPNRPIRSRVNLIVSENGDNVFSGVARLIGITPSSVYFTETGRHARRISHEAFLEMDIERV